MAFLGELVAWLQGAGICMSDVKVDTVSDTHLEATLRGEKLDPERHQLGQEIKAVTYHKLVVEEREGKWYGQVVLDI